MKLTSVKRWIGVSLLAVVLMPGWAAGQGAAGGVVVFGTSLSDPGNAFALTGQAITAPYDALDALLVPNAPYARGGHHFSNGATWVEQFAANIPAFQSTSPRGTNYAVGGARARNSGVSVNLSAQVSAFLADVAGAAPPDALYVIEMGSNDVRDALADFPNAPVILNAALTSISDHLLALYAAGARKFLVLNVPDIGLTPAVRTLGPGAVQGAGFLTQSFNANLENILISAAGLPGIEITRLDVHQKLNELVAYPAAFGFNQVEAACITPRVPPFTCQTPDKFLFWDGIHPTRAVHAIIARKAVEALAQ
ncbi:MAG: SGNH/GDSL hydrolase family protein [Pseudomonadota bacterium]